MRIVAVLVLIAMAAACRKGEQNPTGPADESSQLTDEQYVAAVWPLLRRADGLMTELSKLLAWDDAGNVGQLLETQYSRVHARGLVKNAQAIREEAERMSPGTRYRDARSTFLEMVSALEAALTEMHASYTAADPETRKEAVQKAETGLRKARHLRRELDEVHHFTPRELPGPTSF